MTATILDRAAVPDGLEFDPATDPQRRRHLVLAMPWGASIDARHKDQAGYTLERGDVLVDRDLARQAWVNVNHRPGRVGFIVDAVEDERGIWAVIDLDEDGERVLAEGNGDVSAEIIQPNMRWYLAGIALISGDETPAIPGSRVVFSNKPYMAFAVEPAANRRDEGMTTKAAEATPAREVPATPDFDAYMLKLGEKVTESHNRLVESLGDSIGQTITAGVKAALESLPSPQGEQGPEPVRAARFYVTREAPVYTMNGAGHSLVRDAWYSGMERDADAAERMRKYRLQTEEIAKLAMAQLQMQFTTASTSNASQVIPPGYRPDLYVPQLQQQRPLAAACSQGIIASPTPFTVPVFGTITGATADHVEGTNPTDGTLTFATKTVTPGGISGKMILTREIVDASNPVIDQIALAAMRESYARQTEAKVYTLLNGANGAGGVITTGFVPSGSQASTYAVAANAFIAGIRKELARYDYNRFASPDIGFVGQNAAQSIAGAVGSDGRPLLPWAGVANQNVVGLQGQTGWVIDGVVFAKAWSLTGTAAGDAQIMVLNRSDAWVFESPTLTFQFFEKSGPANVELALFGYFGTHLLRPVGLSGIRLT